MASSTRAASMVPPRRSRAAHDISMPDVQKRLADQGDQSAEMTPTQLAEFLREERERWGGLIRTLGLQVQ